MSVLKVKKLKTNVDNSGDLQNNNCQLIIKKNSLKHTKPYTDQVFSQKLKAFFLFFFPTHIGSQTYLYFITSFIFC